MQDIKIKRTRNDVAECPRALITCGDRKRGLSRHVFRDDAEYDAEITATCHEMARGRGEIIIEIDDLPVTARVGYDVDQALRVAVQLEAGSSPQIKSQVIDPTTTRQRAMEIAVELTLGLLASKLAGAVWCAGDRLDVASPVMEYAPDAQEFERVHAALEVDVPVSVSVVVPADLSHTGEARRADKLIDPAVAETVRRLNHPIFGDLPVTAQSCSGHGEPATITMADGRTWVRQ